MVVVVIMLCAARSLFFLFTVLFRIFSCFLLLYNIHLVAAALLVITVATLDYVLGILE